MESVCAGNRTGGSNPLASARPQNTSVTCGLWSDSGSESISVRAEQRLDLHMQIRIL